MSKEIQKNFIPLERDEFGKRQSVGFMDSPALQFFGYYAGAQALSGDYFDYRDLDGRYFAVIKADVAGKGVAAALIMMQVATLFSNYFRRWKPANPLEDLVYQINDFLEKHDPQGRFAAFTLGLIDSQTGLVHFCNAGDNIIHWYDAMSMSMKSAVLPSSPAVGALSNAAIADSGGYLVQSLNLKPGDILLLYTDGIESIPIDAAINALMGRQQYFLLMY